MNRVFLTVLNMSLSSAVVIAVVLAARFLLRKAPKKWSYLLWAVAGFRLCCPVSIGAAFSIFRLGAIRPAVTQPGGMEYIPREIGTMAQPRVHIGPAQVGEAIAASLPAAETGDSVNPLQVWIFATAVLWCAGMAALLIYALVRCFAMRRVLADAVLVRDTIYETDRIRSPLILGVCHPRIYLPVGLDGERLSYVLAHEQYHIRRKDHLVKPFAFALLTVHWFNPLVWLAFCFMGRDMEMSCDEKVLADGDGIAGPYSMALLFFASGGRFPSPGPLAFGEAGVKGRIRNALRWKRPRTGITLAAVLLCAAVAAACGTNPVKSGEAGPLGVTVESVEYGVSASGIPSFYITVSQTGGYGALEKEGKAYRRVYLSPVLEQWEDGEWRPMHGWPLGSASDDIPENRTSVLSFQPSKLAMDMWQFYPEAGGRFRMSLSVVADYEEGGLIRPGDRTYPDIFELPPAELRIPAAVPQPEPLLKLRSGDAEIAPRAVFLWAEYGNGSVTADPEDVTEQAMLDRFGEELPELPLQAGFSAFSAFYGEDVLPGAEGLRVYAEDPEPILRLPDADAAALSGLAPGEYRCVLDVVKQRGTWAEREEIGYACLFRIRVPQP